MSENPGPAPRLPFGLNPEQALVAAATILGLILRVWVAARTEVWLDEANSVLIALSEFSEWPAQFRLDSSPPLFYLVLKGWAFITPLSPLSLRIPSLLFGCATIPAIWWVGRQMDRPTTGIVGAWLLAFHPLHTLYSEEIRMYSMLAFFGLVFYFAVFHLLREKGRVLPVILSGSALAYTHYYGLVLAGVGLLMAVAVLPDRRRKAIYAGVGVGLAYIPWLPIFLAQLGNSHHIAWLAYYWDQYPGVVAFLRTFQAFLPGGMKYEFVPLYGLPFQPILVGLGLLPFLALAVNKKRRSLLKPLGYPLGLMALTLLVLVVRSYVSSPIYLAGRSDIVVLPLFLLALAMAVGRMNGRLRVLFVVAWVSLSALEIHGSAERLRKTGNAELAAALDFAECSTIVATGLSFAPVKFYEMLEEPGARVVSFPIDISSHPGNMDPGQYTSEGLARDAAILLREHPPGRGLCILTAGSTFAGPLAEAFLSTGARARHIGVFNTSLISATPYTLVA
ncbi:MAG: glycosyltransferase family 39 protein, partial [Longimicrobiales bacterium]|nr:glycosyltransferase family 39 protein [Longimicrobiales bacterium]